uniref:Uncharacterized protein n=1 Tax=Heterorhabditis bacteriophora TaxID=37862 RepID=A0A1I7X297_HETBA
MSLPCCSSIHPECAPIHVYDGLPSISSPFACYPYSRSFIGPIRDCNLGARQQMNFATGYLDGSTVYGTNEKDSLAKRTMKEGKLLSSYSLFGTSIMESATLFSHRTSFLDSIWISQHNNIAEKLKNLNPSWSDEELYQESRRVVIAQIQHITFNEYLPLLLGKETMVCLSNRLIILYNHGLEKKFLCFEILNCSMFSSQHKYLKQNVIKLHCTCPVCHHIFSSNFPLHCNTSILEGPSLIDWKSAKTDLPLPTGLIDKEQENIKKSEDV